MLAPAVEPACLTDCKTARQANIDSFQPGTVEGIQADSGRGASAIYAASGVGSILIERSVIQVPIRPVSITE